MKLSKQTGQLYALSVSVPYQPDPMRLYQQLCGDKADTLLLESAEIQSKHSLKSLLMVDAALQLVCREQQVTIRALSANGAQLLPWLAEQLAQPGVVVQQQAQQLLIDYSVVHGNANHDLDEDQRLRALSNLEPLRVLQQRLQQQQQHPLGIFLGGVFAYDLIASFEDLAAVAEGENDCPDYQFYLAETLLIIDHQQQQTELLGSLLSGPQVQEHYQQLSERLGYIAGQAQLPLISASDVAASTSQATSADTVDASPDRATFSAIVEQMKQHIGAGDIFQVVPSRRFRLPCHDVLAAYRELKRSNPSPYMFLMRAADFSLFGASPESALKYEQHSNQVELYPIAGTRPRGKHQDGSIDADLDSRLELDLRLDQKELAEHLMLVDLSRNDLARIAQPGSRYVADLLKVDRYSHVMHLVSRVVAQLQPDLDALHAYRACMNMGTLVGAPKISAASLIRAVEQQRRGSYGGAVGYLSGNGDMDTCIVIRSAFVKGQTAYVQAGAGVVYDSQAAAECDETENKARAVIQAIQQANQRSQGAGR
ncbi:anthranilate synthase component 1 [Idiomarina xiamenensis]|uniref:Anthranilate synthase component 1 n=1 Tax=Idiomarina xiamenensis 10-D-4 TaxID=740709 RepID=K2L336_9GAMM|nr:anthranilate synthase component 1 [Idiomarina xiamenensis]EKE84310.1 anthranilate synthase component I [Idiomarina xiamenensis 10-D-4]